MAELHEKEEFLEALRRDGHRVTSERLALFDEIFTQHGHIDADHILASMKRRGSKISRATVYRNLDLMADLGLVRKQRLGQRRFLFEHIHTGQQHDHLVCTGCGKVVEFVSPGINALQTEICRAHSFVPRRHGLQILGLCKSCAEDQAKLAALSGVAAASASGAARVAATLLSLLLAIFLAMPAAARGVNDDPEPAPAAAETVETGAADATGEEAEDKGEEVVIFERLKVVGSPEAAGRAPGSAHYLGAELLEQQDQSDIHRVLQQIPGVNLQEEEGYGLRPNIGMRGAPSERSSKITLLEDGVLIAPAPYASPSAYYFPTTGRMEALEVEKGPSSIRQGPYTTGGVLNLISSSIPSTFGGRLRLTGGDDGAFNPRFRIGDSRSRLGWMVEGYRFQTDGFKDLDGGGETGFTLDDYLGKLRYASRSDSRVYQALELKVGRTEQLGDETYLGLTDADFGRTPFRRYAGSQEDFIDTLHEQVQLRYFLQPSPGVDVTATYYHNDFFRNWHKLETIDGSSIASVLRSPEAFAGELDMLRGDADSDPGAMKVRNNRRNYYGRGVQAFIGIRPAGANRHQLEIGVRYHEDREDRFQEDDRFQMLGGRMLLTALGAPGSQSNRISDAEALAVFAQDTVRAGRFTLTPGLRFESIDFVRRDFSTEDPSRQMGPSRIGENGVDVWIPGLGVAYEVNGRWNVFGGIHKGFSPPGAGRSEDTQPEESLNLETGVRYASGALGVDLVGFFTDYDNLLGSDTTASGGTGTGDLFNGGEVEAKGVEAGLRHDFRAGGKGGVKLPLRVSYTYTSARFQNTFESAFAPWGSVEGGDFLPYIPKHRIAASLGVVDDRWSAFFSASHLDAMRTEAGAGSIGAGEGTDSHLVLDLSGEVRFRRGLKLLLQIRNLTDETYVAARRPAGIRPGLPRTLLTGLSWDF